MSYGASQAAVLSQVASMSAASLKGEGPADLPVQQSVKFEPVINLKTAKASGPDVPDELLALADPICARRFCCGA
jgi:putative ABC transport system substrate-binding protein